MSALRRYGTWRRATQVAMLLLYLGLPWAGGVAIVGTHVALRVGGVDLLEPSAAASAFAAARVGAWALLLGALPLLLLAVVLGPVYCSWTCPFGLVSEVLDAVRRGRGGWRGRPWQSARRLRPWALAAFLALSVLLGLPLAGWLAPPRLVSAFPLELRAAGALPPLTCGLLAGVLALELLLPRRIVCRALCPAGAVLALTRTRFTLAPRFDASACRAARSGRALCAGPAPCFQSCPWGVDPRALATRDGCTSCLACLDACPAGALTIGAGPESGTERRRAPAPPAARDGSGPMRPT